MPAYRSEEESAIRRDVIAELRAILPDGRIMEEVNIYYGENRVDVMSVSPTQIFMVEIKSEKDVLKRLPAQINAMRQCSHVAISAINEKFLVEKETNKWAAHFTREGKYFLRDVPDDANGSITWVWPKKWRAMKGADTDFLATWQRPDPRHETALPHRALSMLWRDELKQVCAWTGTPFGPRDRMDVMIKRLLWRATGKDLTLGICRALRAREIVEGDPAILEE